MKTYIILYEDRANDYNSSYDYLSAPNITELIRQFADTTGDDSDLFELAITGLNDANDLVQMYNHFAYNIRITDIYELGKAIYTEDI